MNQRRWARSWVSLALVGAIGCSENNTASKNGDGDGDGDMTMEVVIPTEGPVGAEELPVYLAQIACDQFEECGCPLDVDLATCRIGFASQFRVFSIVLPMYSAEYDPVAGRVCLDAALASGCDDAFWISSCGGTVVGLAGIGESCVADFECVGARDDAAHCGEQGLCESGPRPALQESPRGTAGSSCHSTCLDGYGCLGHVGESGEAACYIDDGLRCSSGTCEAASGGGSCERIYDCSAGDYCSASGSCTPFVGLGQSCVAGTQAPCGTDAYCKGSTCSELLANGQTCQSNQDCASRACAGEKCVEEGTAPVCSL